jgi:hypothetical protein
VTSGYYIFRKTTAYYEQKEAEKFAHITAQIWVATARYNDNPERYRQFRDSLLSAENISKDDLNDYLNAYQKSPEKYLLFVTAVNVKIDSIAGRQDSLLNPRDGLAADSVIKID